MKNQTCNNKEKKTNIVIPDYIGAKEFENEMKRGLLGKFKELINAKSFSDKTTKTSMIILGEKEKYWVTTFRLAGYLEKHGYEIVNF